MSEVFVPGRQDLATFAKNPRLLRAFEDLFRRNAASGDQPNPTDGASIQAAEALDAVGPLMQLIELAAFTYMPEQQTFDFYAPPVQIGSLGNQEASNVSITGGTINGVVISCNPLASAVPTVNGQLTIEATSNTSLTFRLKGSDGVVRSNSLTLT